MSNGEANGSQLRIGTHGGRRERSGAPGDETESIGRKVPAPPPPDAGGALQSSSSGAAAGATASAPAMSPVHASAATARGGRAAAAGE